MKVSIESSANPRIKELVRLRESPRRRKERGVFFVEGGEDLLTLAEAGQKVEEVYYCTGSKENSAQSKYLRELQSMGIERTEISIPAYTKASYRSASYGMIGLVRTWELGLNEFSIKDDGPLVVLDEVEKPGNLGAILRSVEAFGATGVILSDPEVDFYNPNVVRSSRGLMGRVPVAMGSKEKVYQWLQNSGRKVIATSSQARKNLGKEKIPPFTAFVFGSEKCGLGEFWKKPELEWMMIPMQGTSSSLNFNVSVACLLYEYNRGQDNYFRAS